MKIITIPHPTLRTQAAPVTKVDRKLQGFLHDLEDTLARKRNPQGVGLAAPQVDVKWRVFVTQLTLSEGADPKLRHFINPEIIDKSSEITFGPDKKEPVLEGCLSIPGIYGPVPRHQWIELKYDLIVGNELVSHREKFADFAARVVQHEQDHLNGILFIDYTEQYDLPLYKENKKTDKLYEIEDELVPAFIAQTK